MLHSVDFRKRALAYMDEGHTYRELRMAFKISSTSVREWRKMLNETGSLEPRYWATRKGKIDLNKLRQALDENPGASLRELANLFKCSRTSIFYALPKLNRL